MFLQLKRLLREACATPRAFLKRHNAVLLLFAVYKTYREGLHYAVFVCEIASATKRTGCRSCVFSLIFWHLGG